MKEMVKDIKKSESKVLAQPVPSSVVFVALTASVIVGLVGGLIALYLSGMVLMLNDHSGTSSRSVDVGYDVLTELGTIDPLRKNIDQLVLDTAEGPEVLHTITTDGSFNDITSRMEKYLGESFLDSDDYFYFTDDDSYLIFTKSSKTLLKIPIPQEYLEMKYILNAAEISDQYHVITVSSNYVQMQAVLLVDVSSSTAEAIPDLMCGGIYCLGPYVQGKLDEKTRVFMYHAGDSCWGWGRIDLFDLQTREVRTVLEYGSGCGDLENGYLGLIDNGTALVSKRLPAGSFGTDENERMLTLETLDLSDLSREVLISEEQMPESISWGVLSADRDMLCLVGVNQEFHYIYSITDRKLSERVDGSCPDSYWNDGSYNVGYDGILKENQDYLSIRSNSGSASLIEIDDILLAEGKWFIKDSQEDLIEFDTAPILDIFNSGLEPVDERLLYNHSIIDIQAFSEKEILFSIRRYVSLPSDGFSVIDEEEERELILQSQRVGLVNIDSGQVSLVGPDLRAELVYVDTAHRVLVLSDNIYYCFHNEKVTDPKGILYRKVDLGRNEIDDMFTVDYYYYRNDFKTYREGSAYPYCDEDYLDKYNDVPDVASVVEDAVMSSPFWVTDEGERHTIVRNSRIEPLWDTYTCLGDACYFDVKIEPSVKKSDFVDYEDIVLPLEYSPSQGLKVLGEDG